MKILLLDNYDSFTWNLVHLVEQFDGVELEVIRNDEIKASDAASFDRIILSPGPGLPSESGILLPLIRQWYPSKSILGVCLGLQAIAEVFGAQLLNLGNVQHGVATETTVIDPFEILYKDLPVRFRTGRYHSWIVDRSRLPECLAVTAEDPHNRIMSLRHKSFDVSGVQFHPESVLTEHGKKMIGNWLGEKTIRRQ